MTMWWKRWWLGVKLSTVNSSNCTWNVYCVEYELVHGTQCDLIFPCCLVRCSSPVIKLGMSVAQIGLDWCWPVPYLCLFEHLTEYWCTWSSLVLVHWCTWSISVRTCTGNDRVWNLGWWRVNGAAQWCKPWCSMAQVGRYWSAGFKFWRKKGSVKKSLHEQKVGTFQNKVFCGYGGFETHWSEEM